MKFYFSRLHRNWSWVAEIILISANHMYLMNKEYFFNIPMYYVVCNNQNSLERAEENTHFFQFLRELLDKIRVINLFCSV